MPSKDSSSSVFNKCKYKIEKYLGQRPPVVEAPILVDTYPHLDGEHNKFIDPVHFAAAGNQQMAETVFAALKPILEAELRGL
jgi:lysophospholipase L1-like esterase